MVLEKKPFTKYNLDEDQEVFTVRLNDKEKKMLFEDRKFLKQIKQSTALKQMWMIGRIVLHDPKIAKILEVVTGNLSRNERIGLVDPIETIKKIEQM